jgi:subtilase family serine protease
MAINYSSGDYGDLKALVGSVTVSDLSASPFATSVGGTTLALDKNNKVKFQTGWGNNITKLAASTGAPVDPPLVEGFIFGAGGGESQYFAKPSWQSSLPGSGRQQPDISLDSDPYTGVEIVVTLDGTQGVESIGGTSLACPAFSGIWAIANQRAGQIHGKGAMLGQAAPIIAKLAGSSAITDVLPYSSPTNVAGFVFDSNGTTFYSPDQLAAPLENTTEYLSDLYNSPSSGSWFALTFGTDTSLVTTPGWDNVTGFGTPNGLEFIHAAAK